MSQVDEEEEFFSVTFLESLPDGAIYLDGRDRMEKEIDVSLYVKIDNTVSVYY